MELEIKEGYEFKNELKELFTEYANLVVEGDKTFEEYLKLQVHASSSLSLSLEATVSANAFTPLLISS